MLAKCANPSCAAKYRFLHQGKVFIFAAKGTLESRLVENVNFAGVAHGLEYIWLCNECRRRFIVDYNQTWGFQLVKSARRSRAA